MKSVEQVKREKSVCRKMLCNMFHGQNGVLMRSYLADLLDVEDLIGKDTHDTYFKLGKSEALKLLIQEGEIA